VTTAFLLVPKSVESECENGLVLKRSAPFVLAIGGVAYISAVSQRSSMGVASLVAQERFHTNAQQLASLAVLQVVAYAAMQIPVGILLDRFGSRILLAFGALSMSVGQYTVAFSTDLSMAVFGRFLVGFGDAFTFISMIRLINGWYQGKRASQLQQWIGNGGQLGQVVSAVPFAYLLHMQGWEKAFAVWATIGLLIGVVAFVLVKNDAHGTVKQSVPSLRESLALLKDSIRRPSTRMAFWTHFSTQSTGTLLVLLWGVPFLVQGEGLSRELALTMLSSYVFIGVIGGFGYGFVCSHFPSWRRNTIIVAVLIELSTWVLMLGWPGRAPVGVIWLTMICTAAAQPSSMIAFDYSRQYVPKRELGTSNGFINIGGFISSLTMMYLVGLILDLYNASKSGDSSTLYSIDGFKFAFCTVFVVVGFGLWRYSSNERATNRLSAASQ